MTTPYRLTDQKRRQIIRRLRRIREECDWTIAMLDELAMDQDRLVMDQLTQEKQPGAVQ